jgi:hypothetical protein
MPALRRSHELSSPICRGKAANFLNKALPYYWRAGSSAQTRSKWLSNAARRAVGVTKGTGQFNFVEGGAYAS